MARASLHKHRRMHAQHATPGACTGRRGLPPPDARSGAAMGRCRRRALHARHRHARPGGACTGRRRAERAYPPAARPGRRCYCRLSRSGAQRAGERHTPVQPHRAGGHRERLVVPLVSGRARAAPASSTTRTGRMQHRGIGPTGQAAGQTERAAVRGRGEARGVRGWTREREGRPRLPRAAAGGAGLRPARGEGLPAARGRTGAPASGRPPPAARRPGRLVGRGWRWHLVGGPPAPPAPRAGSRAAPPYPQPPAVPPPGPASPSAAPPCGPRSLARRWRRP